MPARRPSHPQLADIRGWWLAAEVLSPSSRLYDREVKRAAYLALGVEEYWIVNPEDCSVERWPGERVGGRTATEGIAWRPAALDREIVIDLREVFEGGLRRRVMW